MQSAAGGTSQRLKPAVATVRSLSRMPGAPDGANVVSAVVIGIHLRVRGATGHVVRESWTVGWRTTASPGRIRSKPRRFAHRLQCARPTGILIDAGLSGDALSGRVVAIVPSPST